MGCGREPLLERLKAEARGRRRPPWGFRQLFSRQERSQVLVLSTRIWLSVAMVFTGVMSVGFAGSVVLLGLASCRCPASLQVMRPCFGLLPTVKS